MGRTRDNDSRARKEQDLLEAEPLCRIFDARGDVESHFLHYHDCLEINVVLGGSGVNYIDSRKYTMETGDVYLINNFEHHFALSQKSLKMKIILFDPASIWQNSPDNYEYLSPFYSRRPPAGNKVRLTEEEWKNFLEIIGALEREYREKKTGYLLFVKAKLMELMALIYRTTKDRGEQGPGQKDFLAYEKIRPSVEFIQTHFQEELHLGQLAELSCMSKTYFCSCFKNIMKMTAGEYMEQQRISRAMLLAATTELSVTEICYQCGYNNISSFNAAFRKLAGMPPSVYRKKCPRENTGGKYPSGIPVCPKKQDKNRRK